MNHFLAMLIALGQIESGNNDNAVGANGERGRYQILESTWRENTCRPFANARWKGWSDEVAVKILIHNREEFRRVKKSEPTVEQEYAMWNAGSSRVVFDRRPLPREVVERAERFNNLYVEAMDKLVPSRVGAHGGSK